MNKKTVEEIKVGEFTQLSQNKDTIFNEAGKKVTIKTQYKGFVEAVESFSETTVRYNHNWLQFNIEKGLIVIMLDKNLDLNILVLTEVENEDNFHQQYGLIKLFASNDTEEIINFLELSTNFLLNLYDNLEIVLENEEASFKLVEDMMNELNSVEAVEEVEADVKKTIGEIKVGEFANTLVMDNTSYNEAGKRITIKTQFKGLIQAIEALVPENTKIDYSKDSLGFDVEGNIITIVLDSHLNLNVLLTVKIQGDEVTSIKKIGWLKVFVSNDTEEIINFLESFIEYLPNGKFIVLENENAGFKLIEEMLNNEEESGEQEEVEAIEEEENNIMENIVEEKVLEEKINKIVQEAYVKGIQDAQEELRNKEYLSFKDIGEIYDLSRTTINKWVELGLPLYKIDRTQFIKRSEINNFIDSHQV